MLSHSTHKHTQHDILIVNRGFRAAFAGACYFSFTLFKLFIHNMKTEYDYFIERRLSHPHSSTNRSTSYRFSINQRKFDCNVDREIPRSERITRRSPLTTY